MRFFDFIKNIFSFKDIPEQEEFELKELNEKEKQNFYKEYEKKNYKVSADLNYNLDFIKKTYNADINTDLIIREFDITVRGEKIRAFLTFFDGMVDDIKIGEHIMEPLMKDITEPFKGRLADFIVSRVINNDQTSLSSDFTKITDSINFGGCVIFLSGSTDAVVCDVKGWERRGISEPKTETVIKGPHEAFNETLKNNVSLVRKILKNKFFVAENMMIGEMSKSHVSLLYLSDVTNSELVAEIRRRLKGIKVSYIMDSGELQQMISCEDKLITPMMISTERPDRVAMALNEGKAAVIIDGSPYALIMPVTANSFLNLTEDRYLKPVMTNFLRVVRVLSIIISLMMPGFFIAVVTFHPEFLETELFFTIESGKNFTPFPLVIEILLMEFAFELIKEAGIRIPGQIGSTIGIVGAIILGQAAVDANLATPILIIIIALTGLGSFATPHYEFAFSLRIIRILYILMGAMLGFFGLSIGIAVHFAILSSIESFGVPFLAPFSPRSGRSTYDSFFVRAFWKQEERDDVLQAEIKVKQPHISRKWIKKHKNRG